ncbi:hypothetical protein [Cryobacterium zhongshanensis]|uniref:Uncharacterized protein n=1 Tax=Cryobacterium zhongshanensis TaxID=2928153 RepID=A0AA41QYA9_9MICO|nr:hypothetical protein [Cryobacterium zhongshanensis]MCI4659775.1 hypothetical protein [Cryobacterium zhongshanensis]
MEYRIDPASYSQISGMTYAEAVTSVMARSDLREEQAQAVIDIKQFAAPRAPEFDEMAIDAEWAAFDALGGGETDERAAFRAGVFAGARLANSQHVL